ncbi:phosphatase PAP2 family protein [Paenibacillus sp. TRM 82003]|uniref:phosphatase PAP2 family protein n=1 Tax=Kineococcus sp. TRM81007 TaxID=2925831 RepID=UPI001F567990|nr:phosphatase PAP2 family protein [Kineococcus sp. TRM81007]MCI2238869.1 phosphatase PAP2 family protein [Kineococcus sp. TRM81007]MCI3924274.1 phosphatase PAP2 family protein [Paenibacillus sp. TRM 82003]
MPAGPAAPRPLSRRNVLTLALAGSAATVLPLGRVQPAFAGTAPTGALLPFVEHYTTNVAENTTQWTNAAVRILSGFDDLWETGPTWDTGRVLDRDVLRANVQHVVDVTHARTDEEAKVAFVRDRQHQSYAATAGLGPLAELYREGAQAVTGITEGPDGTPPEKVSDELPADAPAGSALGAGSETSELGFVAQLVNAVRGPHASSNPSKNAYQYPRPWRLDADSEVAPTGEVDEFGFPVYASDVVVAPQLLRQRGDDPAEDGGFPSGHTNAFHLAALALAHAVPERFQELIACAFELSDSRIVTGMHSPLDVVGGRVLATALAAAALHDPANAVLKQAARDQAAAWFQERTGTDATGLVAFARSGGEQDPWGDRDANRELVQRYLTYGFQRTGPRTPMVVPHGAEVLLETRLPYLSAAQRREVLRTTALPAGYPVLDGPELWGRLDLFTAADGYGRFDTTVAVDMDAAAGGFSAADAWRNDVTGRGDLVKRGSGELTLSGDNSFTGGTRVAGGILVAASPSALGRGDVTVAAGALRVAAGCAAQVRGDFSQAAGAALEVAPAAGGDAPLRVRGTAALDDGAVLRVDPAAAGGWPVGEERPVLRARRVRGGSAAVEVAGGGRAELVPTRDGVSVRLLATA